MSNDNKIKVYEALIKRLYKLLNEGQGIAHLEVDGIEADNIMYEIKKLGLTGK